MSDFSVSVGGDFSEILRGFAKLPNEAQKAGDGIGKGLSEGVDQAADNIGKILTQIKALRQAQAKIPVDSSDFIAAEKEIDGLKARLSEINRSKVKVDVDESTIGGLRLIDGAIQGIAFSLTNTVTNAAGAAFQALQGLINGFAALDTEIRQAAAAGGEAGGYDKIARAIDQVGIDAAGTTIEVARLYTELVRGGMTIDQTNASLGAIVRGAEATGTGFAEMGSVVSASIKGFGLAASDAQRVVDALVTGANASATSVSGMGMAFKYAAPVARILGVSVEELGIAVGLLTNAGIDASEAGVTLRNGLSKLASAAPQTGGKMQDLTGQAALAAKTMKQLGLDIYEADGTLKPMEETLLKLKGAFDKLDPSTKIRMAANMFGGEDDGTKWLALLNQSQEEIKKMAATMASTKGATDTARNAMQGFQLTMNQLTGTLDSLGNTLGKVAAAALLPLVQIANQVVGAIAGLPEPVKTFGSALILVGGSATIATAALVIFQRAMTVTAVQAAVAEIVSLGGAFRVALVGGIQAAIGVLPGLLTQLSLIGSLNVTTVITTIAKSLYTTFLDAVGAAARGLASFLLYIDSANFASFIASIRATVVAMAPLVVATAAVAAAVATWQYVLGGANKVTDDFADAQKQADEAVANLGATAEKTAASVNRSSNVIATGFKNSRDQLTALRATQELDKLQGSFAKVEDAASAFYVTLKGSESITDAQVTRGKAIQESLNKIGEAAKSQASRFRVAAEEAARAGSPELTQQLTGQAVALEAAAERSKALSKALETQISRGQAAAAAVGQNAQLTKEQTKSVEERTAAEEKLNRTIAEAPVRNLEGQLALGQQLLGLTKSIGELEQSRFGVVKAGLQFELQKLQERGAGEDLIRAKKAEIDRLDRESLSARYRALQQQQQLEMAMLALSQEKARLDANLEVQQQRIELLKAEKSLNDAKLAGEPFAIAAAQAQRDLQAQMVGIAGQKVTLLAQTQPLEAAIARAQGETARNGLQAQAAAEGFRIAADGTLIPVQGMAASLDRVSFLTAQSAGEAERYRQIAAASGIVVAQAADGTLVLGQNWQEVGAAVGDVNRSLVQSKDQAGGAKTAVDGIGSGLAAAKQTATAVAGAFMATSAAAVGAKDFATYMAGAKGYSESIDRLALDTTFGRVSSSMGTAASSAKAFYGWLEKATALPGARWSGGPVEAGGEYKINELGQEAFLTGGRLSLIDAPPNTIWRAPSAGVVIPAGVTARLQAAGSIAATGGAPAPAGVADLAIELGKLRQEVGELARRSWNIQVSHRTGPTGSQVLRTLQQLR